MLQSGEPRAAFAAATAALGALKAAGVRTASNINLNRLNPLDLEPLFDVLKELGIGAWQVQLTAPLGRAPDRPAARQKAGERMKAIGVAVMLSASQVTAPPPVPAPELFPEPAGQAAPGSTQGWCWAIWGGATLQTAATVGLGLLVCVALFAYRPTGRR